MTKANRPARLISDDDFIAALRSHLPTPEENAEHYIVVNCGVRNPYLRRFYETRKLYF